MTENEFTRELKEISEEARLKIVELVKQARDENADGFDGKNSVDWYDNSDWSRAVDGLIELGGWVYDRLDGKSIHNRSSMRRKLRKALGYTYP